MTKTQEFITEINKISKQLPSTFGVDLYFSGSEDMGFIEIIGRLDNFKTLRVLTFIEIHNSNLTSKELTERIVKDILHSLQYAKLEKDLALMMES